MPRPITFRDYNQDEEDAYRYWGSTRSIRPLWALLNDKTILQNEMDKHVLDWCNQALDALLQWKEPIVKTQRRNMKLYKGRYYMSESDFYSQAYNKKRKYSKNHARIVVPYLYTATEQHVSDLSSYEPALEVSPGNQDEVSKVNARGCKDVLDYYFYQNKLTTQFQRFHRRKKICGEAFFFCLWNPDAGDIHPSYKKLREQSTSMGIDPDQPIPLVDPETGAQIDGDGGPLFIERPVKTGDIQLVQEYSERVLYPCPESYLWDDIPYLFRAPVWMDVDEVKARWPHVADQIKESELFRGFTSMAGPSLHTKVAIRYLYHKPTPFLDKGFYAISTDTVMLEMGDYPFKHGMLPCIRGTDIDLEDEIVGMSFFQLLASLAYAINDSTSMILQNQELYARPKMQIPRGAKIRRMDMDDDRGVFEYSGTKGAEIMAVNSTPADTWKWRDVMRDEFQTHSAIFATSRGRGVDGITANVALRLIDEQERKMHKPAIDKHSDNCVQLGTQILSLLGTYRDPSDGMLIKVLGKNSERYIRAFDIANFNSGWEVQLAKASALPQSPAAKAQLVLDYAERFPTLWTDDEVLEHLGMKRPEKMVVSATASRESAESEIEDLLQGYDVPPPSEYVDILPRYGVYVKSMQNRAFDAKPPQIKDRVINHVVTAEYLIQKRMMLNPALAQKVMEEHPYFPLFFPQPKQEIQQYQLAVGVTPQGVSVDGTSINAAPAGGIPPEMAGAGAPMPPVEGAPAEQGAVPVPPELQQPTQPPSPEVPPAQPLP